MREGQVLEERGIEVRVERVEPTLRLFALREAYWETRRRCLPIFVAWRWKWPAGVVLCVASLIVYSAVNRHVLSRATRVPLFTLDHQIPLIPWTVWLYLSGVLFLPAVFLANRCRLSLNRHLWSFGAAILVGALFFELWPTRFPRELFPLPLDCVSSSCRALQVLRDLDPPANAAPSLHVTLSVLIALGFLEDRLYHPWPFLVATAWAALLSFSTLTTKQHSVFDALLGLLLAGTLFWVFHRRLPVRVSRTR